jgi:hypothetical protein
MLKTCKNSLTLNCIFLKIARGLNFKYSELKRKTFSEFVGIKRIVRKMGDHNDLAKSLGPSFFARVVFKSLPRIKGRQVNFLHENRLKKGLV